MYVCTHKQKYNFGTLGTFWERREAFGKHLNALTALEERVGAFGRLGIIPYDMVCVVWCLYSIINKQDFCEM